MVCRKSGVLNHISSLPSKYGIGDFGKGAFDFIDFLKKAGMSFWQILPMGHTSFGDSPYQSFSTFAGNPLFISIDSLIEDKYISKDDVYYMEFDEKSVEYDKVIDYKYDIYRKAFENFLKSGINAAFEKFCNDNKGWLDDYSLFMSLKNYFIQKRKNTFGSREYIQYKKENQNTMTKNMIDDCFYGAAWNSWPKDIAGRNRNAINMWNKKLKNEVMFYKFLQFLFFEQWGRIKSYANENNIQIIGDIPIFVASDSADTWANRKLFCMDSKGYPLEVAGVPPDYFSETGQLWGNPLYKWEEHKKDNYKWWSERIKAVMNIVDYVRIDHFRAFESYWSIKYGEETAVNGEWKKGPNEEFFEIIERNIGSLNIIAEDLGDLNEEVLVLRDKLKFPGMKVLQFAFEGGAKNEYLPHNFENSNFIVYTGTHDNDTTIGWYNSAGEQTKDYFRRYMNVSGKDVNWDMIRLAYSSTAKIAIIPIQDIIGLGTFARMNQPGTGSGNWKFRFSKNDINDDMANRLYYLGELFGRNNTGTIE